MNGLPVLQKNDPEKLILLGDPCPLPYPAIGLDLAFFRELDYSGYPLVPYSCSVGPFLHVPEITAGLQIRFLYAVELTGYREQPQRQHYNLIITTLYDSRKVRRSARTDN